jgi:hypothetical protein
MKNSWNKKGWILGVIVLLFCSTIIPGISSKTSNIAVDNTEVDEPSDSADFATLTFYTYDESGKKENKIDLPVDDAKDIFNMFENLKNKTVFEPNSLEAEVLKNDFIDLLEINSLAPRDLSEQSLRSLINPQGDPDNPDIKSRFPLLGHIFDFLFKNHFNFLKPPMAPYKSEWNLFCNIASGGLGIPIPMVMIPRPRAFVLWLSSAATTLTGSLLIPKSFIAAGSQQGVALGFSGVGLTIHFGGFTAFAFLGYAAYTLMQAEFITRENYPSEVTNENPSNGANNVPIDLDELSFNLMDADGDLMDYTVTTSPDIGSKSESGKGNGVYKVPVSNLVSDTDYSWYVTVDDGYDTVNKHFSFKTEAVAPVISDPSPSDGELEVPASLSQLSFKLKDFQGDLMDYTVETVPDIGSGSASNVGDGTYSVDVGDLDSFRWYTWYVNVTDGTHWTRAVFDFQSDIIMIFDPFNEGWSYRKMITIDHNMVDGNLVNFPVLISMVDSDLRDKAQFDGDDILFMDGLGVSTMLFHEIESYEGSSGELVAWVKIPSLSSSVDTILYMYYGNPGCSSQEYPERVWNSDYIHVWHLGDDLVDSAGSDDGTNHGDVVSGKVGKGRDFEQGESDYINLGDMTQPADGSLTTMTWECWVKPETQDGIIMTKYDSSGTDYSSYHISFIQGGKLKNNAYSSWGAYSISITDNGYAVAGQWIYLSSTWNLGGINNMVPFIDGGEVSYTQTHDAANVVWNTPVTDDIGRYRPESSGPHYADAVIDELRWSKIVRNDDWIKTSYNTMNNPSGFFSVGPEET